MRMHLNEYININSAICNFLFHMSDTNAQCVRQLEECPAVEVAF
jgi:hypothetical protein